MLIAGIGLHAGSHQRQRVARKLPTSAGHHTTDQHHKVVWFPLSKDGIFLLGKRKGSERGQGIDSAGKKEEAVKWGMQDAAKTMGKEKSPSRTVFKVS